MGEIENFSYKTEFVPHLSQFQPPSSMEGQMRRSGTPRRNEGTGSAFPPRVEEAPGKKIGVPGRGPLTTLRRIKWHIWHIQLGMGNERTERSPVRAGSPTRRERSCLSFPAAREIFRWTP